MRKLFNQLIPFILLGTGLVVFALGIVLFAYLLLFGAILGGLLFMATWIRETYLRKKNPVQKIKRHRIIEIDDWERK